MVMEASPAPSPQSVGREFVRQYYTLLNKAPAHLHRFYNNYSSFVHGGLDAVGRETPPVIGQKQIHHRIQQLNFRDCHAKISQVDSQATLGAGVVVQVSGELSNGGAPMRRFTQTFVLAAQSPKKYYVHNDIFRYQDIVFSDEEGSGSGRSEGEDEDTGYFPAATTALAAGPAAQPADMDPLPPATASNAQLNGHQLDERHLVQTDHITSSSLVVEREQSPEPEPEPLELPPAAPSAAAAPPADPQPPSEPERSLSPEPPRQPVVMSPPEPKTYANLLKSSVTSSGPALGPSPALAQPPPPRTSPPTGRPSRDTHTNAAAALEALNSGAGSGAGSVQPAGVSGGGGGGMGAGGAAVSRRYSDAQQLFLGNVPHSASEDELKALFARFGPVHDLRLHLKPNGSGTAPRHPNYGFITFESASSAAACLRNQPLYFPPDAPDAVKLNVEEKKARAPLPRRRPTSGQRYRPQGPPQGPSAPQRR